MEVDMASLAIPSLRRGGDFILTGSLVLGNTPCCKVLHQIGNGYRITDLSGLILLETPMVDGRRFLTTACGICRAPLRTSSSVKESQAENFPFQAFDDPLVGQSGGFSFKFFAAKGSDASRQGNRPPNHLAANSRAAQCKAYLGPC
jgi:hypothetical protein